MTRQAIVIITTLVLLATQAFGQGHKKIDSNFDGFDLVQGDLFGTSVENIGDLDGDGIVDIAIGATKALNGPGTVWIAFLNPDGSVKENQKITLNEGGMGGDMHETGRFGSSIENIGDIDGDGVNDLAVSASTDIRGVVWILTMTRNGTVKNRTKITSGVNGGPVLPSGESGFGRAVSSLGDLDGDGITDIAVGLDTDSIAQTVKGGAVFILFLNADGTVKEFQKINAAEGDFTGGIESGDDFGWSITTLGDLDEDGVVDIAVGAVRDRDSSSGISPRGAVYILFLNANGTVKAHQKISSTAGDFNVELDANDFFGISLANLGDLDEDGVIDLGVGAAGDDDGSLTNIDDLGAIYILNLTTSGLVKKHEKISSTSGNFSGILNGGDSFGRSIASLGDLDGDGTTDLAVGASGDDGVINVVGTLPDQRVNSGAIWIIFGESNQAPLISNPFSDVEISIPDLLSIELKSIFADADGDELEYRVENTNPSVVSAEIDDAPPFDSNPQLALMAESVGMSMITVTADDNRGGVVKDSFMVDVPTGVIVEGELDIPQETIVDIHGYPNPFSVLTTIEYTLPAAGYVSLKIFNPLGQEVKTLVDNHQSPGNYVVHWTGDGFESGVYFYQFRAGKYLATRKVTLLR